MAQAYTHTMTNTPDHLLPPHLRHSIKAAALDRESIVAALQAEYERHAHLYADTGADPLDAVRMYHQGCRDGLMLALTLISGGRQ